jgi:predicted GTPase
MCGRFAFYSPSEAAAALFGVHDAPPVESRYNIAPTQNIAAVRENVRKANPAALIVEAASPIFVEDPAAIRDKRVLVVEDGPTLTHGDMAYGAGVVAARRYGACEIIDPRPYAVRSIAQTFVKYPKTGALLPAMGYGEEQIQDLEETINATPCDLVIIGTPIDLRRVVKIKHPADRVYYELQVIGKPSLEEILQSRFAK